MGTLPIFSIIPEKGSVPILEKGCVPIFLTKQRSRQLDIDPPQGRIIGHHLFA